MSRVKSKIYTMTCQDLHDWVPASSCPHPIPSSATDLSIHQLTARQVPFCLRFFVNVFLPAKLQTSHYSPLLLNSSFSNQLWYDFFTGAIPKTQLGLCVIHLHRTYTFPLLQFSEFIILRDFVWSFDIGLPSRLCMASLSLSPILA